METGRKVKALLLITLVVSSDARNVQHSLQIHASSFDTLGAQSDLENWAHESAIGNNLLPGAWVNLDTHMNGFMVDKLVDKLVDRFVQKKMPHRHAAALDSTAFGKGAPRETEPDVPVRHEETLTRTDHSLGNHSELTSSRAAFIGYMLTIALSATSSLVTVATGFASKSAALPHYTENFFRCTAAMITMFIVCLSRREKLIQDPKTLRSSMWLSVADWFFLWGYVEAMFYLDATQYTATSISMSSIFSVILGACILSEGITMTKVLGVFRNIGIVILVLDPLGFFHGQQALSPVHQKASTKLMGFFWGVVAVLGTVFMRIIQRSLTHVPPTITSFWCFAVNTILWLPPGSIPPEMRVPILWPRTAQDQITYSQIPGPVWACMLASGIFGGLVIVVQAFTLRYIDVGTYTTFLGPIMLVCSFVLDQIIKKQPQPPRVIAGILLAVIGMAAESFSQSNAFKRLADKIKGNTGTPNTSNSITGRPDK